MKNAVIYVFSGTGNTLKIARAYADEFFSRGVSCKIHILEKDGILRFPPPQDFDLAGLAYPIHAFNAPYVVPRFAAALSSALIILLKNGCEMCGTITPIVLECAFARERASSFGW